MIIVFAFVIKVVIRGVCKIVVLIGFKTEGVFIGNDKIEDVFFYWSRYFKYF